MTNKELFLDICKTYIKREGIDKLLTYLETTDWYTAPASTKYHGSYEGGLLEHSLNVYKRLIQEAEMFYGNSLTSEQYETIAICALFHDICKTNFYVVDYRNVKNKEGVWESVPYYTIDDKLPYGHGEKSVYILTGFMKLSREEALTIRWHMFGFDDSVKGGSYSAGAAYEKFPFALLLHVADLKATYFDEAKTKSES